MPLSSSEGRAGYRMGNQEVLDICSTTVCRVPGWTTDGCFAEATSEKYSSAAKRRTTSRESVRRALAARPRAISPRDNPGNDQDAQGRGGRRQDETPSPRHCQDPDSQAGLQKDGTVTAASSSGISDGAAALVLARESFAAAKGYKPMARFWDMPVLRATGMVHPGPRGRHRKLLAQLNWQAKDVDLYEINEAFAAVPMAASRISAWSTRR